MPLARITLVVFAPVLLLLLAGCGGYTVQGRVVAGSVPMVLFVPPDDEALAIADGIEGAHVEIYRDPQDLNRTLITSARTGADGAFAMSVDGFGAGWMDELWEIRGTAAGYLRAEQMLRLPSSGSKMRLLVILPPGRNAPDPRENLLEEAERYRVGSFGGEPEIVRLRNTSRAE